MHVLYLTVNYPNSYNKQSHIFFREQAESLASSGLKMGVISSVSVSLMTVLRKRKFAFGIREYSLNGVDTICLHYPAIPKLYRLNYIVKNYLNKLLLKRYIKKYGKPDLIHNHVSLVGKAALYAKKSLEIPYIVTEHYTSFLKEKIPGWRFNLAKSIFQNSNINIAVSESFAGKLNDRFKTDFMYLPNFIDTKFFKPLKNKSNNNQQKRFINIGNTVYQKNQSMLIRAFAQAFKGNNNYSLLIVGSGSDFESLQKLVDKLEMQNQITLYGQATREEVLDLLQNSDYFVLSSHYETFGVVIIEAMACGLPVVTTKCIGPESILTNDELGFFCDIEQNSLSSVMKRITQTNFDRDYILSYVNNNFSNKAVTQKLIKIYEIEINR